MTLPSAASELALLEATAREAGALARELIAKPLEIVSKRDGSPVTNVDRAVNALLAERLQSARPDYGWLSEETPDAPAQRIGKPRVFVLDPIDGTVALIRKLPEFTISIGIVVEGQAFAGAIHNPVTEEIFLGALDHGATLNGAAIRATERGELAGARVFAPRSRVADALWRQPGPSTGFPQRRSIAYRLAAAAAGQADATVLFGFKHEWDVAAGAAIVAAAGGAVSDLWGEPLVFNQVSPKIPGLAAAGARLHPLIIERTSGSPDPRAAS
ncbi:MAG: inositol monophosphatase family protein [Terricaulis sp.]